MYEGVKSEIKYTTKLDENSDLGKTYLDEVNIGRSDQIKAKGIFPISEQSYTSGNYLMVLSFK